MDNTERIIQLSNAQINLINQADNIRFELKKLRSKADQCALKSVRLKVLDRQRLHIFTSLIRIKPCFLMTLK